MSDIEQRVKKIVAEQLGVAEDEIKLESSFVDDLGADSLDTVELVMALEDEFEIEIPDELINQEIPKISLQPIVENAVVHGAAQKEEDCLIMIRAQALDGCCRIEVIDDGAGLNGEQLLHLRRQISGEEETCSKSGNGIGLKNVQERIQMTFGEAYGLEAFSEEGQGTMIRILVPIHPDLSKEGKDGQGTDCRR